jgi:hypothetical protein
LSFIFLEWPVIRLSWDDSKFEKCGAGAGSLPVAHFQTTMAQKKWIPNRFASNDWPSAKTYRIEEIVNHHLRHRLILNTLSTPSILWSYTFVTFVVRLVARGCWQLPIEGQKN